MIETEESIPLVSDVRGGSGVHVAIDRAFSWLNGYRTMEKAPACEKKVDISTLEFLRGSLDLITCARCLSLNP